MWRINALSRAAPGAIAIALLFSMVPAGAQPVAAQPVEGRSVSIAAGVRYQAGTVHRWFSGNTYRDLWVTPIRVPVLELSTYAGGLTPTKAGGGLQTKSIRFEGADGIEYVFRLTDKSINSAPKALQNTPAVGIFQDEVSALHPAAAMISGPIVEAAGVLHVTAVLMVMGDDPALGQYRAEFAGRLGMIEEYPSVPKDGPGFGGATKIIDSEELLKLLNTDATQHIDARAFLAARLTDFLINDNDRHQGNWKWARLNSGATTQWEPIARDRDHAFVSYDGLLLKFARLGSPGLVAFGNVPDVNGLTRTREFDARLLAGLEKPVWDSVARALQGRITDAVIAAAAREMPIEYLASAPKLEAILRKRRDALAGAAHQFYMLLAARVDVHATDASDRASITRTSDGFVDVRLESGGTEFFSRRFDPRETSEILVYLHNGNDTALVTGRVQHSIPVRVIGGNGTNTLVDSSTVAGNHHPTRVYDAGKVRGVSYGLDTLFDRRPWENKNGTLAPAVADAGTAYKPVVGLAFHRHVGMTPRIGIVRYSYGFARRPYASMVKLEGEYAIKFQGVKVGITVDKRLESSPLHFMASATMSNFDVVNFNGFGNATIDSGSTNSYFEVRQTQWMFHPAIALAIGSRTDISLGPVIQHSVTDSARNRYLAATRPYGFGTFNQAGVQLGVRYEWRTARREVEHTHDRLVVALNGQYFPATMDVRSAFEAVSLTMGTSIALPIPTHPLIVFRAGGKKLYGDFPFYEAAMIGGEGTTRYMDTQRYAGDASLYGTSELRIPLVRFKLVVPLRAGLIGIAEAGRVYYRGDSPGGWYTRTGEGVWFGRGDASSVVTFTRTTEPGHPGLHFRLGLNF